MNNSKYFKYLLLFILFLLAQNIVGFAQEIIVREDCNKYFKYPYVSDGQVYRAGITEDEVVQFKVTFFGNAIYRIARCSKQGETIRYRLIDSNNIELFNSNDVGNPPYWDFQFESTVDCIIEASRIEQSQDTIMAVINIGFKQFSENNQEK